MTQSDYKLILINHKNQYSCYKQTHTSLVHNYYWYKVRTKVHMKIIIKKTLRVAPNDFPQKAQICRILNIFQLWS